MAASEYDDERLVRVYDDFNGATHDTDFYARQLGPEPMRIADIGCGTGTFALRLARAGHTVTAVDPAPMMLAVARGKAGSEAVTWIEGTARDLPDEPFAAAVMTGHAFQCLLTDEEILETLTEVRRRLVPGGRFMFETRNPARRPWLTWQHPDGPESMDSSAGPLLVAWTRAEEKDGLVTLEGWTRFERDGTEVRDVSTLRFIEPGRLSTLLGVAGFTSRRCYGDWTGAPFEPSSSAEIIVVATA